MDKLRPFPYLTAGRKAGTCPAALPLGLCVLLGPAPEFSEVSCPSWAFLGVARSIVGGPLWAQVSVCVVFEQSPLVCLADLKVLILLHQSFQCWDYTCATGCLALSHCCGRCHPWGIPGFHISLHFPGRETCTPQLPTQFPLTQAGVA